jgi:hypothetical protein
MADRIVRSGEVIHHDKDGNEYVLTAEGQRRPPMQAAPVSTDGFKHYDESAGHCGLCGRLDCRGNCFR